MAEIQLKDLTKRYNEFTAVNGIDLHIPDGSFVVLVGPSGCGKSTTLRMLAGLETVTEGSVLLGGRDVTDLEPRDRDVAMVFQNYALYPHMSIYDNMAFGLRAKKTSRTETERRVREAAQMLGITELLGRRPKALSGGQQQRVAMGRAMVRDPAAFLFDEPLSNLDAKLRVEMREELLRVHKRLGNTVVYVTHDQEEAMTLSDIMIVMEGGRIMQRGAPAEVYLEPRHEFVGRFVGSPEMNVIEGSVSKGRFEAGEISISLTGTQEGPLRLGIRPEDVHLYEESNSGDQSIQARVEIVELLGSRAIVTLHAGGHQLKALVEARSMGRVKEGDTIDITFDRERIHMFDAQSGLRNSTIKEDGRFDASA